MEFGGGMNQTWGEWRHWRKERGWRKRPSYILITQKARREVLTYNRSLGGVSRDLGLSDHPSLLTC